MPGILEQLEALGHALRDGDGRRGCRRLLALHRLGARHMAADARPQRDGAALLGDAAAREGEAPGHLQRLAGRLQGRAEAAGIEELHGDADGQRERAVGAAVGGAARHQAKRVVGEGQRCAAMHAAGIVAVPRVRRQHAMHAAGFPGVARNPEIERPDMILERIRRHEDRVAAKIDGS
jgi:hypothetical protein